MALGTELQKKLSKKFEPSATIHLKYKGKDLTVITDREGEAVTIFIGTRKSHDLIVGERYVRRIVRDDNGNILKSHWDNKGKV